MTVRLTGGCTCGAVRYHLTRSPLFVHACHCTWCQRETGGPHAINVLIETDAVQLEQGAPENVPVPSASGSGQQFLRCGRCQVALWSHYSGLGTRMAFVRAGTLDEPGAVQPDIHIFTSTKLPWYVLPDGVPAVEGYYSASRHWPPESLRRREALKERG